MKGYCQSPVTPFDGFFTLSQLFTSTCPYKILKCLQRFNVKALTVHVIFGLSRNLICHVIKVARFRIDRRITERLIAWDREQTPFLTFLSPIAKRALFVQKEKLQYFSGCNYFARVVALGGFGLTASSKFYLCHLGD